MTKPKFEAETLAIVIAKDLIRESMVDIGGITFDLHRNVMTASYLLEYPFHSHLSYSTRLPRDFSNKQLVRRLAYLLNKSLKRRWVLDLARKLELHLNSFSQEEIARIADEGESAGYNPMYDEMSLDDLRYWYNAFGLPPFPSEEE